MGVITSHLPQLTPLFSSPLHTAHKSLPGGGWWCCWWCCLIFFVCTIAPPLCTPHLQSLPVLCGSVLDVRVFVCVCVCACTSNPQSDKLHTHTHLSLSRSLSFSPRPSLSSLYLPIVLIINVGVSAHSLDQFACLVWHILGDGAA